MASAAQRRADWARDEDIAAFAVLDRRLSAVSTAPIGVAFSGGGDSLMALKATKAWADRHGRSVIALHVDHRLQSASAGWASAARQAADRLEVRFLALSWDGAKPSTGLAAAAREARHRLIADAARRAGVRALVIGHTADDQIEAELMRAAGHRMGDLRAWSPSPVWPEGRGLFHVRPLLGLRRTDIRERLAAEGETWIDDPMNQDLRSPRARARLDAALMDAAPIDGARPSADDAGLSQLAANALVGEGGDIHIDRKVLRAAPRALVRRLVGAAAVCAGGQARPTRGDRLDALADRLCGGEPIAATLSGAKVLASIEVVFARDAGEASRGGLAPLDLGAGQTGVWDGRFEITAHEPAIVTRLAGNAAGLDSRQTAQLKTLPASVRPGLPVMVASDGQRLCPILAKGERFEVRLLVAERLAAACGVISKEPAT